MAPDADEPVRRQIEGLLLGGLVTEVFPRADDGDQFQQIIQRIRLSDGQLETRLVLGGFTLVPVDHGGMEQACDNCMYYQVHRRYCVLPELDVPVAPKWSCRLWRI